MSFKNTIVVGCRPAVRAACCRRRNRRIRHRLAKDARRLDRRGGRTGRRRLVALFRRSAARPVDSRRPEGQSDVGAGPGARGGSRWRDRKSRNRSCCRAANLDASALYQRAPENYIIPPPLAGHTFWMGQAGASLGWDLDFFGKQANAVHRAQALTQSARAGRRKRSSCSARRHRAVLCGAVSRKRVGGYRRALGRAARKYRRPSRAAASPRASIPSSNCAKPKASCRRRTWRAIRRRPPRNWRCTNWPR